MRYTLSYRPWTSSDGGRENFWRTRGPGNLVFSLWTSDWIGNKISRSWVFRASCDWHSRLYCLKSLLRGKSSTFLFTVWNLSCVKKNSLSCFFVLLVFELDELLKLTILVLTTDVYWKNFILLTAPSLSKTFFLPLDTTCFRILLYESLRSLVFQRKPSDFGYPTEVSETGFSAKANEGGRARPGITFSGFLEINQHRDGFPRGWGRKNDWIRAGFGILRLVSCWVSVRALNGTGDLI